MKNKNLKTQFGTDQPVTLKKPDYSQKTLKKLLDLIEKNRKIEEEWQAKNIKHECSV